MTQNVDNLHEQASSQNLLHMHGELLKARCTQCESIALWEEDLHQGSACNHCLTQGCMRPHIVWFGEMPLYMENIEKALIGCDLFVSIGTSGNVYPAAGFVQLARASGATTLELNLEPSSGASSFHHCLHGPAATIVPEFFHNLERP